MNSLVPTSLLTFSAAYNPNQIPASAWWWTVGAIALLLVGVIVIDLRTRMGIIARATIKESVRQPVFFLLLFLSLTILVLNTYVPFFSFGEDTKMLKDCGLATLLISGLLLAIWNASNSIAAEIEGKTTMTLLSKPINRRQFIVGKYLGITQAVLVLLIPLILAFLFLIYYKVGYDAREVAADKPPMYELSDTVLLGWTLPKFNAFRLSITLQVLPGIVLIFLEIVILTAVSVAISTRAPMVVNMVSSLSIFVIGHLAAVLVKYSAESGVLENVKFMAQLIATLLPSLEMFNTQSAVATGTLVPPDYLGLAALYAIAYSTAAILLGFILFEDHDLS